MPVILDLFIDLRYSLLMSKEYATIKPEQPVKYRPMVYWPLHVYARVMPRWTYVSKYLAWAYMDQAWAKNPPPYNPSSK